MLYTHRIISFALILAALALPAALRADLSATVTLNNGTALSLDNGTTASSGGDILWDGTNMNFEGNAKGGNIGPIGATGFGALNQTALQALQLLASSTAIPASTLVVGDVFAVVTNGGHVAKVLVTAVTTSSITLQYTTYGVNTTPTGPTITGVTNNYSYIPAGFPSSGITPSSIFVIFGSDLADAPSGPVTLQSSAAPGLPTTLANTKVSVTVNGTTVTPAMYYAIPTAIAAVMPANTPTGTGTITVTYKGTASNVFTIQVVPTALGLDTYYGTGNGLVTATNPTTGALYNFSNSAAPGDTIVLWGSGLGADASDSDTVFTTSPHTVNMPITIYFGGVAGTVLYSGSSGYPGLDQINVTIPQSVPTGCNISVVAVTGSGSSAVTSNFGTLAINQGHGQCSDALYGNAGSILQNLSGKTTVNFGDVFIAQSTSPDSNGAPQTYNLASAIFEGVTGASFSSSDRYLSEGGCIVNFIAAGGSAPTVTPLDAGTVKVTGPSGTYPLSALTPGFYQASLPSGAITSSGGTFTFAGAGGANVGPFSAAVTLPNPLISWTNQTSAASVTRSSGLPVTWTGGASGSYVIIAGSSSGSSGASGSYTCIAPQSALQFTVPGYVLGTLPPGKGTTTIENATPPVPFTASGLDYGLAFGFMSVSVNTSYQ